MKIINTLKDNIRSHWEIWLVIFTIIIGYFQISFFLFPLKFGAITFHYPWRYGIVESIKSGALPFWYFTQHVGIPIHADPQSGAWYPLVWFFSLFSKYSIYSFHVEFMLHIIIAGLGMQYLAKAFGISKFTGVLVSLAYVFSGIFSDNVLTSWTISMAWTPMVMTSIIRLGNIVNLKNILTAALSLTMLITGGYPAFTILLSYLIFGFVGVRFFQILRHEKLKAFLFSGANLAVVVLTAAMSMVVLWSVFQSLSFIGRTQPLDINYAADGMLNPKSFLTLVLPFSAVGDNYDVIPGLETYFTMANSYFGIIPLLFVLMALFDLSSKRNYLLFSIGIVLVLFSMGSHTFLYSIFFSYLPGFNLFRYPNFARAFFIPIFLLIAGSAIDKYLIYNKIKQFKFIIISFLLYYLITILYIVLFKNWHVNNASVYDFFRNINLSQRMLMQSFIQIGILILFYFIITNARGRKLKIGIFLAVVFDLLVSFQLNFIYTGYAPRISVKRAQTLIDQHTSPILIENNQNVFSNCPVKHQYYFDYGFADYQGRVASFGNVSFKTNGYDSLINIYPKLFKTVLSNPVLYFSTNCQPTDSLFINKTDFTKSILYISKQNFDEYESEIGNLNTEYQLVKASFLSNKVKVNILNPENGFLTLLQNYYLGWSVFVNGVKQKHVVSNLTFISVFIEKGNNKVEFIYENRAVTLAFYASAISFFIVFLGFLYLAIFKSKSVE